LANEPLNEKIDPEEGTQIEGAHEAANASDTFQPSHWTAGKEDLRSESDILAESSEVVAGLD
jgi:hypothetical protein